MSKRPTIRDVAARAGVSIATVSKFINATQRFTPAVEAKIRAAIDQLGFRSNPLARGMITGKTGAVGLVILDIANPHFTSVVKGAHRVAVEAGYDMLLADTEESVAREKELLGALAQRVDGLIVSTRVPDEQFAALVDLGKPVVVSGRPGPPGIPGIGVDTYAAGRMIGELLASQRHRRIAWVM